MADRMIHQRVWKVSKELDKLALQCEQHKLQMGHRQGLPDWERPRTPAGVSSRREERVPAFFAWDGGAKSPERRQQQPEQEQEPQPLHCTPTRKQRPPPIETGAAAIERVVYATPTRETMEVRPLPTGMEEATAIAVDGDGQSEDARPPVSELASETCEEQDVEMPMQTASRMSSPPPRASPYQTPSSPRYRYGRRLKASDAAIPKPVAAGISTVAADRHRMNRWSGKRLRSPARQASLWDDLCNSYIHQSGDIGRNDSSYLHKRRNRSAADDRNNSSSVHRTLNMDTYRWPQSPSERGERYPVVTGPQAMQVANQAVREFLGDDEESKHSEPLHQQTQERLSCMGNGRVAESPERVFATPLTALDRPATNDFRKRKTVSFDGEAPVGSQRVTPTHVTILADKMTQTDDALMATCNHPSRSRTQTGFNRVNVPYRCVAQGAPECSPASDVELGYGERPRKIHRRSSDSPVQQTNPILLNLRYPPEPTAFRGRSTHSTVFSDRPSRR